MPKSTNTPRRSPLPPTPDKHWQQRPPESPQNNPHPYAIKTTSTALLSRSNSTGNRAQTHHHYIPSSPSPSSKHRPTKSETSIGSAMALQACPRPLPIPPSMESPTRAYSSEGMDYNSSDESRMLSWRSAKTHTLPVPPLPVKLDDLPSNPRVWTTSQLSSYLVTALRVHSGDSLPIPPPVAQDIVAFVKETRLNGRAFLRLSDKDLEQMGINNLWRSALLNAARSLRQNVFKGRIWGFHDEEEDRSPFLHARYSSSSSSIDLAASLDSSPSKTPSRHGRVRGMVETLERSSSFSGDGGGTGDGTHRHDRAWLHGEVLASDVETDDELSDVGDRPFSNKNADLTDAGAYSSPASSSSPFPATPPPELHTEIPADVFDGGVVNQANEPTVQELLAKGGLSGSWGAKAWEEFDVAAAETMKRVAQEEATKMAQGAHSRNGSARGKGSGKGSDMSAGGAQRAKARDIFARPLPTPPTMVMLTPDDQLQTPTKKLMKHQCIQTTDAPEPSIQRLERGLQTDSVFATEAAVNEETEHELQKALALVEEYKARLHVIEAQLVVLERERAAEEAKLRARSFASQAVETIPEADGDSSEDALCPSLGPDDARSGAMPSCEGKASDTDAIPVPDPAPTESTALVRRVRELPVPALPDWRSWKRRFAGTGAFARGGSGADAGSSGAHAREWDPLENGLSSYVFMVGVGVCAVVLHTLLKRLAGRKA